MHARLLKHASLLWVPETTDAIRTAHESVIGQILTMNLLRIQAFWSHYRFRRQNPPAELPAASAAPNDQRHFQSATYVAELAGRAGEHSSGAGVAAC